MIVAENLTKRYGDKTAVDGISFTVAPGRVTGFLGPNGAGKSTTMRMIVGLYPAALANTALRDATRAWLSQNADAAPALRRLVGENLAGVERALAVQERDAA